MTRASVAIFVVVALARGARAGEHCDATRYRYYETSALGMMYALERFAHDPRSERDAELAAFCLYDQAELKPRIVAACTRILDRDPDWASCYVLAAAMGQGKLGKHDVFAWVAERPRRPGDIDPTLPSNPLALLASLRDRRGAALVVATWTVSAMEATRRLGERAWRRDWTSWRIHAAATLGALGTKDTLEFLDAQMKVATEADVKKALRDAAAAIRAR
jgi:hypothetical protein